MSDLSSLQSEIQRLLGRCLLKFQHYELVLKDLVAKQQFQGPAHDLRSILQAQIDEAADKTLGGLIGRFLDNVVVPQGRPDKELPDSALAVHSFEFHCCIEVPTDEHERLRAELKELVTLRNGMVHHFLDRFKLASPEGCAQGLEHLRAVDQRIHTSLKQLRDWTQQIDQHRSNFFAVLQSDQGFDAVFSGVAPDGRIDWKVAGCVSALLSALRELAVDGWAPLTQAVLWINQNRPEQTPQRYGCRTWPELVHKSGQFDLVRRERNGVKARWLRARSA